MSFANNIMTSEGRGLTKLKKILLNVYFHLIYILTIILTTSVFIKINEDKKK